MDTAQRRKNRAWEKKNNFERFNFCLCLECAFFAISHTLPIHGDCILRVKEGVHGGVMAAAICDRFISSKGTDINGKKIDPAFLSTIFKIETLDNGEIYIPKSAKSKPN